MKLIIVSGLSGSGKSIALHTLEDLGYYCVDNLPMVLLPAFAAELVKDDSGAGRKAAVAIDARNRAADLPRFPILVKDLEATGLDCEIVFLSADDDALLRRFSETRRRHPLSGQDLPLAEAIALERGLLEPISVSADWHIDTTHTNVHQLRDLVRHRVERKPGTLSLLFQSFGFKHGVPNDTDFVFDVRCLPNPHWEPRLRPLTGCDREVIEFLESASQVEQMFQEITRFLETWVPSFQAGGRSYLTVSIGCTGGQHRSVYMVERLASHFRGRDIGISTRHRELL